MRYDANDVSKSDRQTDGQLSERPLAELIREIIDADLSGALRLSNGLAKVAIYFEKGEVLYATSNLRAHRLHHVLSRELPGSVDQFSTAMSDQELAAALVEQSVISEEALTEARSAQASDVLRVALLWIAGDWSYDRRVRVDKTLRVPIPTGRLLLESARHLPLEFIKARVGIGAVSYSVNEVNGISLSPAETMTLSRLTQVGGEVSFLDLANKRLRVEESLRGIYALCVAGVLRRDEPEPVLTEQPRPVDKVKQAKPATAASVNREFEVEILFKRIASAATHYEVLDVPIAASDSAIKGAYHDLARRFHPDRFHQSDLRAKIESAFARIGRAYETLIDEARRKDYDHSLTAKAKDQTAPPVSAAKETQANPPDKTQTPAERAEASFQLGTNALQRNQNDEAVRYLAEAASLAPRVARYRAHYGAALMRNPSLRRSAEQELQAALKIEPNNALFRVMLAELYQQVGLRKRAETEAARALSADPTNASARALLSSLVGK